MSLFSLLILLAAPEGVSVDDPIWTACGSLQGEARTACAVRSFHGIEEELTQVFQQVMEGVRKVDEAAANSSPPWRYAEEVERAQKAWTAYRDAECRMAAYPYRNSTGKSDPLFESSCRAKMTRERTNLLRESVEGDNVQ